MEGLSEAARALLQFEVAQTPADTFQEVAPQVDFRSADAVAYNANSLVRALGMVRASGEGPAHALARAVLRYVCVCHGGWKQQAQPPRAC